MNTYLVSDITNIQRDCFHCHNTQNIHYVSEAASVPFEYCDNGKVLLNVGDTTHVKTL